MTPDPRRAVAYATAAAPLSSGPALGPDAGSAAGAVVGRRAQNLTSRRGRLASRVGLLAAALGLAAFGAFAAGCATTAGQGGDELPEVAPEDLPPGGDTFAVVAHGRGVGRSHVVLLGPTELLAVGDRVELLPRGAWPIEDQRPAQALLQVVAVDGDGADAIILGQRRRELDLDGLYGRRTDRVELPLSKAVTTVASSSGDEVRLTAASRLGTTAGDYYFILGEPGAEPLRLGSRIVALARVLEATPAGARARIVHSMGPIAPGAVAVFAQHADPAQDQSESKILFTRTRPDEPIDEARLPALATAVIDYMAEFRFSNISIGTLDVFVDPAAYDAAEQARDRAPDEGHGVVVFGEEREDEFLYNITTYGSAPGYASTVGILPGGLPLETPQGVEGISAQLAPSFLATALTQRGDHAEAIYFLEYCLRREHIAGDVAYHLREHLALRYETLGMAAESFWLMGHDIAAARDEDNAYAELNALSIRQYLDGSAADTEAELADLEAFLAAADDVLPAESLLSERMQQARVLARLDRFDEALEILDDVLRQAQLQGSLRGEVDATFARATVMFLQERPVEAVALVNEVLSDTRVLRDSYPRAAHMLLAQYYLEMCDAEQPLPACERGTEARANLEMAIDYARNGDSPYALASTYEQAAHVSYAFEEISEARQRIRQAASLYGDMGQKEDEARALMQAGFFELAALRRDFDPRNLAAAYAFLDASSTAYMAIGDGLDAAQALMGAGMVNFLVGDTSQGMAAFSRAVELGAAWNDPSTVALAYERMAEAAWRDRDVDGAQRYLQLARVWAETFGLTDMVTEINELEQAFGSSI